jgi:hypothetical protein
MDETTRGVLFLMKGAVDPSLAAALAEAERLHKDSNSRADAMAVESEKQSLAQQSALNHQFMQTLSMMEQKYAEERERGRRKDEASEADKLRRKEEAEKRAQEKLVRESESASVKVYASQKQMTDGYNMATEGVFKLASGLTILGLAGSEDMEAVVRGIARVKGATDALRGVFDIWRGLTDGARAYREAVVAAGVAEQALTAARAANAATGGGRAAADVATNVAPGLAPTIIGALTSLPAAIGAAVVGALAGGAMALNVGGVRDTTAGALTESMLAEGRYNPGITGWAGRSADSLARSAGITGGYSQTVEEEHKRAVAAQKAADDAALAQQRTRIISEAAGARAASEIEAESRADAIARERAFRYQELSLRGQGLTGTDLDAEMARRRSTEATRGLAAAQTQAGSAQAELDRRMATGDMNASQRAELDARIEGRARAVAEAEERVLASTKERLSVEQRIAQERLTAADQAIAKAEQEVSKREQLIEATRKSLLSAEERFGQLDTAEQQRLKDLMRRAQTGGNLSVEEYQALQGVGTEESRRIASDAFRRRASAAGFGDVFGKEEREDIARAEREKATFEATIRDQRELKVTIERDDRDLANRITQQAADLMRERDERLLAEVQRRLENQKGEINRQMEGRLNATRQSSKS